MSRKQIQHIRDLHSQRLLATVVAFDSPEGVKVGWSIANWSAQPHPAGLPRTQQPSKKSGVAFASLNARIGNKPAVRRKAYVRHSFVKTELMQEIWEIAENLRNFLETPKKPKAVGKGLDHIDQEPFAYTPEFGQTPDSGCCGGCSCEDVVGESTISLTCFDIKTFTNVKETYQEHLDRLMTYQEHLDRLMTSIKLTSEAFKSFCEAGQRFDVFGVDLTDSEISPESHDLEKGM